MSKKKSQPTPLPPVSPYEIPLGHKNPTYSPPPPLAVGQRRVAVTAAGCPLRWYTVRLAEPGWPTIPVLVVQVPGGADTAQEDAVREYMTHCGIHDSRNLVGRWSVVDRGPCLIERVDEGNLAFVDAPEIAPGDVEKCGGVDYLLGPDVEEIDG